MRSLTPEEDDMLTRKGACPFCEYIQFRSGPTGGLAVNMWCANPSCEARFSVAYVFATELIEPSKLEKHWEANGLQKWLKVENES